MVEKKVSQRVITNHFSSGPLGPYLHPPGVESMMLPCYVLYWSPKYFPKTSPFPRWLEDPSHQSAFFPAHGKNGSFFKDLILAEEGLCALAWIFC